MFTDDDLYIGIVEMFAEAQGLGPSITAREAKWLHRKRELRRKSVRQWEATHPEMHAASKHRRNVRYKAKKRRARNIPLWREAYEQTPKAKARRARWLAGDKKKAANRKYRERHHARVIQKQREYRANKHLTHEPNVAKVGK